MCTHFSHSSISTKLLLISVLVLIIIMPTNFYIAVYICYCNIPLTYDKINYSKTGAQTIKTAIQNWDGSIYFE